MSIFSRLVKYLPLFLLTLGVIWRLLWLDSIPFSFYHDELDYAVLGQSVANFGTDLGGAWSPWSLSPAETLNTTAELTPAIHGFLAGLFYDSVLWSRVPATLFGLASLVVVWLVVRLVVGKTEPAWWASAALAISPWHIYISRSSFEGGIAVFFLLVFVALLAALATRRINLSQRQFGLVLAGLALSFFLGFFSYHAAKFVLLALSVVGLVMVPWLNLPKIRKGLVAGLLVVLVAAGSGWSLWQSQQGLLGDREGDLVISSQELAEQVNESRRLTLTFGAWSAPLPALLNNKPVYALEALIAQYLSVFDVYRLVVSGYEGGFQFSLIVHGYFFLSTLVAIPAGVVWLVSRRDQVGRPLLVLLLLVLAASPVASAITTSTQSIFRSGLTYALLVSLAGLGLYGITTWLQSQPWAPRWRLAALTLGALLLVGQSFNFAYTYFSQYPFRAVDNHDFSYRLLSEYIQKHTLAVDSGEIQASGSPIRVFVGRDPWSVARAHLGYAGLVPSLSQAERAALADPGADRVELSGVIFENGCPEFTSQDLQIVFGDGLINCDFEEYLATASATPVVDPSLESSQQLQVLILRGLASPLDSHSYYWLLGDQICEPYELSTYISAQELSDFQLNRLSTAEFCQTWVKTEAKILYPSSE